MAKKMNLNGVKDFLFNHGEKVALGTCGFLALFFGITGLMDAFSAGKSESGKPWTTEMDERHAQILQSIKSYPTSQLSPKGQKMLDDKEYSWKEFQYVYQSYPYINIGESADTKRQNPLVLPIRQGPKGTHLDYVAALVYTYETFADRPNVKVLEAAGGGGNAPQPGQPPRAKGMAAPGAAAAGNIQFLKAGDPRRMIIGHAAFPMKEQVLEFQRALKMASQKEMFDAPREDLPSPIGFDLYKIEVLPNGEPARKEPEVLVQWDPAKREFKVSEKLNKFLSMAMFDEKAAAALEPYIYAGLTMPLPQLAFGNYPPIALDGGIQSFMEDEVKDPGMKPKGPGAGAKLPLGMPGLQKQKEGGGAKQPMVLEKDGQKGDVAFNVIGMPRKELQALGEAEQALDKRIFEREFNIFHALGLKPSQAGAAAAPNPQQPNGPMRGFGGGAQADRFFTAWGNGPGEFGADGRPIEGPVQPNQPPIKKFGPKGVPMPAGPEAQAGPAFPNWERDAVVRFIDIDVEPGKSYRYAIRIWMKNPNKGKTNLVAFAALAQPDELPPSAWVVTETITIKGDYHLYAIDQLAVEGKAPPLAEAKIKDATTFQIHQWTKTPLDLDTHLGVPIGDWVVAERVVVHKGDRIGPAALVHAPYWDERADAFKLSGKKVQGKATLKIDMEPPVADNVGNNGIIGDSGYPLLLDFIGGKRKPPNSTVDEEAAVDALIIGVDGKLRVLNSRDASDASEPLGKERQERVQRAIERVNEVSGSTSQSGTGKKSNMPGVNNNN
jgi:hypothetical protein